MTCIYFFIMSYHGLDSNGSEDLSSKNWLFEWGIKTSDSTPKAKELRYAKKGKVKKDAGI